MSRLALFVVALALVPSNGVFGAPQRQGNNIQPSNGNTGGKGTHGYDGSAYALILITAPVGLLTD